MNYVPDRQINPPSFYERETETEVLVKCDLCLDYFPEEEKQALKDCNCVCEACIIMNEENN